jgi:hypothetical protein
MSKETKRTYHNLDPAAGYPAGGNLFYECERCGDILPSRPEDSTHCKCRNIMIDADYGRIKIQDHPKVKLFSLAD